MKIKLIHTSLGKIQDFTPKISSVKALSFSFVIKCSSKTESTGDSLERIQFSKLHSSRAQHLVSRR